MIEYLPRTRSFNDPDFVVRHEAGLSELEDGVAEIRKPYFEGSEAVDEFDEYSVVFLARWYGRPLITARFVLAGRGPIECERYYDPRLFRRRERVCSSSRLYSVSPRKLPGGAVLALMRYVMHVGLDLGLRLDVANCRPRLVEK